MVNTENHPASDFIIYINSCNIRYTFEMNCLADIIAMRCSLCGKQLEKTEVFEDIEEYYRHYFIHRNRFDIEEIDSTYDRNTKKDQKEKYDRNTAILNQLVMFVRAKNKIKAGEVIRNLQKEFQIPMIVLVEFFKIPFSKLGELAFNYMNERKCLEKWMIKVMDEFNIKHK